MKYPRTHFEIYPGDVGVKLVIETEQQPDTGRLNGEKSAEINYFSNAHDLITFMSGLLQMPNDELVRLGELLVELGRDGQ